MPIKSLKKFTHIVIALILASAAGFVVWYYIQVNVPSVKVVTATMALPVGTTIGSQHVQVDLRPKVSVSADAVSELEDVIGKTVILGTILDGDIIRRQHITPGEGGLAARLALLAPGKVACDLPAETATGFKGLTVGDKVNLFSEIGIADSAGKVTAGMVMPVAEEAIILATPDQKNSQAEGQLTGSIIKGAYIIAVKQEETRKVAEAYVKGRKFSMFLLSVGGSKR